MITEARTELWYVWAEIAIDAESDASVARTRALQRRQDGSVLEIQMEHEVKAVLIATSAASHALDAFFATVGELGQVSPTTRQAWKANRVSRRQQILQMLAATFEIGPLRQSWDRRLKLLFETRNSAVHYQAQSGPLVAHPIGVDT